MSKFKVHIETASNWGNQDTFRFFARFVFFCIAVLVRFIILRMMCRVQAAMSKLKRVRVLTFCELDSLHITKWFDCERGGDNSRSEEKSSRFYQVAEEKISIR